MIRATISIITVGIAVVLMNAAAAQMTAPMQQQHMGHSFGDAEKWAREFDNPQRDAWQKSDEVLDALRLQRTDKVADIALGQAISAFELPSACRTARSLSRHRTRHAALPW
jgi:hypothetical protein